MWAALPCWRARPAIWAATRNDRRPDGAGGCHSCGVCRCLFVPIYEWQNLQAQICKSGDLSQLPAIPPPSAALPALQADIDHFFRASTLSELRATLAATPSHFAQDTLKALDRGSPLAIATTLTMQQTLGPAPDLLTALELEYRVTTAPRPPPISLRASAPW